MGSPQLKAEPEQKSEPLSPYDDRTRIGFLRDEYLWLQSTYEDFDKRIVQLKTTATGAIAVAIGWGFSQQQQRVAAWSVAIVLAAGAWMLEAMWKLFQYRHQARIRILERAFGEGDFAGLAPFQIDASWWSARLGWSQIRPLLFGAISFPSQVLLAAAVLLLLLAR